MNQTLMDRLRGFQVPASVPLPGENYTVVWLSGVDFDSVLKSPDFDFTYPFDANFGKMMIRTASHLLGGDACGQFAYVGPFDISVYLNHEGVARCWKDAADLQCYLVSLAASKMSLEVGDEMLFCCKVFSFPGVDLAHAYFLWRQQDSSSAALDRYCQLALAEAGQSMSTIRALMDGMKDAEKVEILRQHRVEYEDLPLWQRHGTAVFLDEQQGRVSVDPELPHDAEFGTYLRGHLV